MPDLRCSNCSRAVPSGSEACPSCGANPALTMPLERSSRAEAAVAIDFLPGQSFADRFTIIERVGAGGMGVVYKAIDTALGSEVGLKLVRPELAQVPAFAERFRREVRLTRRITHPNVCRVHDLGSSGGVLFLSMEWIDGETLDHVLRQAGTLRDARALEIAHRIALALEAAHETGVIHRDLKPANVMLDRRGQVRVLDFGLALESGDPQITTPGRVYGTLLYMAPEQRAGAPVDARADLYALGLILLEMLVGRPSVGAGPFATPPEVNPALVPVLRRLLAEEPARRFDSAAQVRRALEELESHPAISALSTATAPPPRRRRPAARRALWIGAGTVLLAAAGLIYRYTATGDLVPAPARADYLRGQHYLDEESETAAGVHNAIQAFQRAHEAAPRSALILARLGEAYWTLFRRNHSIAARQEAERYVERAAALDPDLPELGLARGIGFLAEGKSDAARAELERVLAGRPQLVGAWIALGLAQRDRRDQGAALDALSRAERLAPESFRVQLALGRVYDTFQEFDQSERRYRRAIQLKPDSAIAWNNLGTCLLQQRRFEPAIEALTRSIDVEEYADARSNLGTASYFLGKFEEAVAHYRRATELEPLRAAHWSNLGDALSELHRESEAGEAYAGAARAARDRATREPLSASARAEAALYCAQSGDVPCALENVRELAALPTASTADLVDCGAALARLRRDDEALDWLERAVRLGASRAQIEARPELVPLRGQTRYEALLTLAR